MAKTVRMLILLGMSFPFLWLLGLALFARSIKGSFHLSPLQGHFFGNFNNALFGADGPNFLRAFITTFALSALCAFVTCALAFPAARLISHRGFTSPRNLAVAFIATRLIPVTAALQALQNPFGLGELPLGLISLGAVYVALYLPIATACLSSADLTTFDRAKSLLELDLALSRLWKIRLSYVFLAGDFVVSVVVVFLFVWSEFYISISIAAPGEITLARHFSTFETINGTRWGSLAASLVISLAPVVIGLGMLSIRLSRRSQQETG